MYPTAGISGPHARRRWGWYWETTPWERIIEGDWGISISTDTSAGSAWERARGPRGRLVRYPWGVRFENFDQHY